MVVKLNSTCIECLVSIIGFVVEFALYSLQQYIIDFAILFLGCFDLQQAQVLREKVEKVDNLRRFKIRTLDLNPSG